jgi:hypothetical protein
MRRTVSKKECRNGEEERDIMYSGRERGGKYSKELVGG